MLPADDVTPADAPPLAEIQTASFLFTLIEAQITRADTKAGLVVAADSVFATALLLVSRGILLPLLDPNALALARVSAFVIAVVFVLLLCSTLFALVAARPNLSVRTDENTLFFFGRISQLEHGEFIDHFSGQDAAQIRRGILTEIHNTSLIAARKFRLVRYSLDFLIGAVGLWVLIQAVVALTP